MRTAVIITMLLGLAGCTVGPNYRRPATAVPETYRNAEQPSGTPSLGSQRWWNVFQDEELQKLIRTALGQNYDIRIAATRILQAQAQLGITRSEQFPQGSGVAGYTGQKIPLFGFTDFHDASRYLLA